VIALSALVAACGGTGDGDVQAAGDGVDRKITLAAYSTPREAYETIVGSFAGSPAGRGIRVEQSYGASGEQSRAVASGLQADVVAFSLAPDITRLVEAGLVREDWDDDAHDGMVTESVVVFLVRKGNPKGIETWDDLVADGVEVVNPNPFVSGGARWNVMAAYGAKTTTGSSHDEAVAYLRKLFRAFVIQPKSAREALQAFVGGKGDVMLAYENEAITAQNKGEDVDYVIPDETLLIENPVALVGDAAETGAAAAFVEYLRSPDAQRTFAKEGYRPVDETVLREFDFARPSGLFEIGDLGGWPRVMEDFFDRDTGVVAEIVRESGAPVDG
jgi:sulfate transport system substrate-binding protein